MDPTYAAALAALAGSVVGSVTSLLTTFLTQTNQRKVDTASREADRRERLYSEFIDAASKLYAEALASDTDDIAVMITAGALLNRMRLFASPEVIEAGERVMTNAVKLHLEPSVSLKTVTEEMARAAMQPLQKFGDACRVELDRIA